jgi:protocatechuate 3,4-dioxygenase beta subunit
LARFTTIYPGFYNGRTVHIHFKVRVDGVGGRTHEFTSQVYFTDAQSDEVFKQKPYVSNKQQRVVNSRDGIFREGGKDLVLAVEKKGSGYAGVFDIGLDMS